MGALGYVTVCACVWLCGCVAVSAWLCVCVYICVPGSLFFCCLPFCWFPVPPSSQPPFPPCSASDLDSLKTKLADLRAQPYMNRDNFRSFFKASFKLSCDEFEKTLCAWTWTSPPPLSLPCLCTHVLSHVLLLSAVDVAAQLLRLVINDPSQFPHLASFVDFITSDDAVKRITFDEWCQFLVFNDTIAPDASNFDEDGACTWLCRYQCLCLCLCLCV